MRGAALLALDALLGLVAVQAVPVPAESHADLPMTMTVPAGVLPAVIQHATPATRDAYVAALEHPQVLAAVPCLCGCQQSLGHESNLDCYIATSESAQSVTYAMHGLDCGVCQAITREALSGARQGLSDAALRELIQSRFGGSS
jgi:hypothetical protein